MTTPQRISLDQWDRRYQELAANGAPQPAYGGPLRRHVGNRDTRLLKLAFDNSPAALNLWNFLLTESNRLFAAKARGNKIIATMKDLGTVPILVYSLEEAVAFYPDGAWWVPCIMEQNTRDLKIADARGIDETFCPVRAMIGAFETYEHFPRPDLLVCSVGATCDDFSAIAQRLETMRHPIFWWEIPARRHPDPGEKAVDLPGGFVAPRSQVDFVRIQLQSIASALEQATGQKLTNRMLSGGIRVANHIRRTLRDLRRLVFTAEPCPLPALELLIAEMLAIHYCSDRQQTLVVLEDLLKEVCQRTEAGQGVLPKGAARIFWVNPVADLRAMNLLESCGGRLCGTEFLFCHALDPIPEDSDPMDALARMALADPMVGSSSDRASRIIRDASAYQAEAVVISRIPGASHCAFESPVIREMIQRELEIPVIEIEVPPLCDALDVALRTRLEATVETVMRRRER